MTRRDQETHEEYARRLGFVLVRSDQGDGGWSLHRGGATDEEIASGDAPAILTGQAEETEAGDWSRPDDADYARASGEWRPTHRIFTPAGVVGVMLDTTTGDGGGSGAAYTREEWEAGASADYERDGSGRWTFLGRALAGRVEEVRS
jgi:hypothetical protein